ncbi:hypothetical protein B0J11DRAFT_228459 [Dendryphion nanum]|uniref:Zn(2)-C6 fungal-type domain-containing protein n=1 Tax=Dendryphion nanum TaxID=256645 RepID=A0A9P9E7R7_9PLEO|nr:hypothetical protein B0J11DRAFT_228459 [Dendryphion nanum]
MPKEDSIPMRKKMRKGTHSCFECRRRKIRCIYPSDNPDVCSECFARGSRCVDQEHADPEVVVDHRKNLRERVSRLEALVDSLLEDKTEKTERSVTDASSSRTPNYITTKDTFPPTPLSSEASSSLFNPLNYSSNQRAQSERGHHVPILSAFEDALNDAEERMKAQMEKSTSRKVSTPAPPRPVAEEARFTVVCKNAEDMMDDNSATFAARKERAKKGLLAALPPYDQLNRILNTNNEWWSTWRRKCMGTSGPNETLPQFAAKALASENIGSLGVLVLAVAICVADETNIDSYIEAVDRWVLSDDEYAATLEGMEVLILKAKWYADIGQPRRAWLAHRKGLTYCQLMGMHRKRTSSAAHESIWWSLYHGDRFLSLLLGLPYGISDAHCDLTIPDTSGEYLSPLTFVNRLSMLCGKVIDRNQGIAEQSFAWALQIDQELEDLWKKLDPEWLDYSPLLADIESNAAELRERLMAQMVYQQIRVYLHLPFMLKSQSNSRFAYSRSACLTGSREVLRHYQALRTGEVQPLYECKAVDFIGFTSAVLIMLGLFNYGATRGSASAKDQETDVRLIEVSIDIFRRASSEKGGRVALQSAEVLEKMLLKHKLECNQTAGGPNNPNECADMAEFVIPYFGTISIRRAGKPDLPMCRSSMQSPNGSTSTPGGNMHNPSISSSTTSPLQSHTQFPTPTSTTTTSTDFFSQPSQSRSHTHKTQNTTAPSTTSSTFNFNTDPFISYDGFYNWPSTSTNATPAADISTSTTANITGAAAPSTTDTTLLGTHVNDDSMNNFPLPTNNFSWQNMPMDIDQDWSWFLNEGTQGSGGNGLGGGTSGVAGLGEQFAQHSHFAGFG